MAALRQPIRQVRGRLPTILRTYCHPATSAVFARLEKDGKGCLPAIRSVLQNESLLHCHSDAVDSLVRSESAGVGAELTNLLKRRAGILEETGTQPQGEFPWCRLDWDDLFALYNHRTEAIVVLRAIENSRFPVLVTQYLHFETTGGRFRNFVIGQPRSMVR